jgi:hypothetical protein
MLRVCKGHYRDSFMQVVFDVYKLSDGGWTFNLPNDPTITIGAVHCLTFDTKNAAARNARATIADAL